MATRSDRDRVASTAKSRRKKLTLTQKRARCTKAARRKRTSKQRRAAIKRCRKRYAKKKPKKPILAPAPPAPKPPSPAPSINSPIAKYTGVFGVRQAERLLWRAGFGPSPGHAEALASLGLEKAVLALTRPTGPPVLSGPAPKDDDTPLEPRDLYGHDHLWFLDRMVRTNQPLVERMVLIWHDWFATSGDGADQRYLIDQNELFRRNALGSFRQMALEITADPAMIQWLDATENTRWEPNENYARELMELFTLGADRGAYTEGDVRELARALTGFDSDWSEAQGEYNFRFVAERHDDTDKTVFGRTGNWNWQQAVQLCLENPMHGSFFVLKLWSYFIPTPPAAGDLSKLEALYRSSGYAIRPVVEAILVHPALHTGPRMVKSPAVLVAGMLRQRRRPIDTGAWVWLGTGMAQRLFRPPNVSGWDDNRWLDTSTWRARWEAVGYAIRPYTITDATWDGYDATETPQAALDNALAWWGNPALTPEGRAALLAFSTNCLPVPIANWQKSPYRAMRQNALRHLIAMSPEFHTS